MQPEVSNFQLSIDLRIDAGRHVTNVWPRIADENYAAFAGAYKTFVDSWSAVDVDSSLEFTPSIRVKPNYFLRG